VSADEIPKDAARQFSANMIAKGYKPAALHAYRDANGVPVFYRIRLKHPETDEKWIRPMHHDGRAFVIGEPPAPPTGKPLYRLPELLADAGPVYVVEGEACADALAALGMIATTSGSAASADAADWLPLRGRDVVIWRDNDKAGERYARAATAKLREIAVTLATVQEAHKLLAERVESIRAKGAQELSDFKLEVAKNYATNIAIQAVEERIVVAIDKLGDRLDKIFVTAAQERRGS